MGTSVIYISLSPPQTLIKCNNIMKQDFDFVLDPAMKRIRSLWRQLIKPPPASLDDKVLYTRRQPLVVGEVAGSNLRHRIKTKDDKIP